MNLKIAYLPGDGIGPEVAAQAVKTLKALEETFGHSFTLQEAAVGATAIDTTGSPLPDATLECCKQADAVLFGAIGDPKYDNDPEAKVRPEQGLLELRKSLGLFANIRPIQAFPTLLKKSPLKESIIDGTDFLIFRELTGGIYFGKKERDDNWTYASDLCSYTVKEVDRIAHLAFKAAKKRRGKLTLVDKANVLETSRLWRRAVTKIGESYPEVELSFMFVDNAAMQLILNPKQFDVILTENMFGDILSDAGSVIGGSIGLLPSASVGTEYSLFEPIHGSYPQAKGKNIANPLASILSVGTMMEHFNLMEEARAIQHAVAQAMEKGVVTTDLEESSVYGTEEVGDYIATCILDSDLSSKPNQENIGLGKSTII